MFGKNSVFAFLGVLGVLSFLIGQPALSKTASKKNVISGEQAENFITKYFPDAAIPGSVDGSFTYCVTKKKAKAHCFVPAMGGRSNGAETYCETIVNGKKKQLHGSLADDFINKHFPDAEMPGRVKGTYSYCANKKTAKADCFVPAMGGRSNGVESSCKIKGGDVKAILADMGSDSKSESVRGTPQNNRELGGSR